MCNFTDILTGETIKKYMTTINVKEDWLTYKNPDYSPISPSLRENRFNPTGKEAFYVASGIQVAQVEIPNYEKYELYRLKPGPYDAFDLPRFARDFDCIVQFIQSKKEGGYGICQKITEIVTSIVPTVSGILYSSSQMHKRDESGYCLAVLPPSPLLEKGFFVKVGSE